MTTEKEEIHLEYLSKDGGANLSMKISGTGVKDFPKAPTSRENLTVTERLHLMISDNGGIEKFSDMLMIQIENDETALTTLLEKYGLSEEDLDSLNSFD